MPTDRDDAACQIEITLETLRAERLACVRRLEAMLERDGTESDVQRYLGRIASINATLVRLAGAYVDGDHAAA